MSYVSQLRKKMGYETNVPRCETCKSVRKPYVYIKTESVTAQAHWLCKAGNFDVRPNACCDKWQSEKGEVVA